MATNSSSQNLSQLQVIKSNLINTLAAETTYMLAHGAKPSYQIDGKNVQWSEFRQITIDKIADLNKLIQLEDSPFQLGMQCTG